MHSILKKIIACPICYKKLYFNKKKYEFLCKKDNISFIIKNKIPVLLKKKFIYNVKDKNK